MHYLLGQPSSAQVRTLDQYRCIASGAYQINNCTGDNTAVTYPFAINRRGTRIWSRNWAIPGRWGLSGMRSRTCR